MNYIPSKLCLTVQSDGVDRVQCIFAFFFSISNILSLVLMDISLFHNCNIHNSHLLMVLKLFCSSRTRKRSDKHPLALFPLSCVRNLGMLSLIVLLLSFLLLWLRRLHVNSD